jgi:acyl-ACP thioesterase
MYEHVNNDFWLSWINEIIENRKKIEWLDLIGWNHKIVR